MSSPYSPLATELMLRWNCLSRNMRSIVLISRYLQRKASAKGAQGTALLQEKIRKAEINRMYRDIAHQMRALSASDGISKEFPEADTADGFFPGRFVEFRISEEAVPGLILRVEQINKTAIELLLTLSFLGEP